MDLSLSKYNTDRTEKKIIIDEIRVFEILLFILCEHTIPNDYVYVTFERVGRQNLPKGRTKNQQTNK